MSTGVVKSKSGLNVRSGPGTNYRKIGALANNASVTINGSSSGWYAINYSGTQGYVSASYVSVTGGATSAPAATASSGGASGTYTVTASALNVRKGAGTNYSVIGSLKQGKVVTASGETNGWLQISYNGQTGYISKKYTTSGGNASSSGTTAQTSSSAKTGKVTASTLNVRKGPGTGYSKIGSLASGSSFSYTSDSNGWLQISYKGSVGYISKQYTTVGGGTVASSGGGSASQTQLSLGQTARDKAASLYSKYIAEGWKYSQDKRTSTGYYDCSSFSARSWAAAGRSMSYTNSVGQAKMIYNKGGEVSSRNLIAGDLLFYHTGWNSGTRWRGINHVAVYDGSGGRYDAGSTPVKHETSIGSPVMCGRPSVLS